jgi:divalent metal cation (Fe/Co/Zn/Cd) transporter
MEKEDIRSLQLTLGGYIVIFILKIVVYSLSGVVVLFAEALHTLTDIFISGFLLIAAFYSRKKADREQQGIHPAGSSGC